MQKKGLRKEGNEFDEWKDIKKKRNTSKTERIKQLKSIQKKNLKKKKSLAKILLKKARILYKFLGKNKLGNSKISHEQETKVIFFFKYKNTLKYNKLTKK